MILPSFAQEAGWWLYCFHFKRDSIWSPPLNAFGGNITQRLERTPVSERPVLTAPLQDSFTTTQRMTLKCRKNEKSAPEGHYLLYYSAKMHR